MTRCEISMDAQSENISGIARRFRVPHIVVRTLIDHYRIPTRQIGTSLVVEPPDLETLLDVMDRHVGNLSPSSLKN